MNQFHCFFIFFHLILIIPSLFRYLYSVRSVLMRLATKMKKIFSLLMVVIALPLALAACGDAIDDNNTNLPGNNDIGNPGGFNDDNGGGFPGDEPGDDINDMFPGEIGKAHV